MPARPLPRCGSRPATHSRVTVWAFGRTWSAPTFGAHGHHYALVVVDGLEPGTSSDVRRARRRRAGLAADGAGLRRPAAEQRSARWTRTSPPRLAFGSCRTSVPHDAEGNASHGVDALRAYAPAPEPHRARRSGRDLVLPSSATRSTPTRPREEMQEFIASRRDIDEPPGEELKDYEEYAHLYRLAWTDPLNRWLLSTLPSAMIFDDHDIRDDWNTSLAVAAGDERQRPGGTSGSSAGWRRTGSTSTSGNLSPEELADGRDLAADRRRTAAGRGGRARPDATRSTRSPSGPTRTRRPTGGAMPATSASPGWSWWTPGRRGCSSPSRRSMLDDDEMAWLDEPAARRRGPPVHRHLAAVPAAARAARPRGDQRGDGDRARGAARGPRSARSCAAAVDLEHWAAFQEGFATVARDGRRGRRGQARAGRRGPSRSSPATCTTPTSPRSTASELGPAPAGSCRRSARRSATRCRAGCGSRRSLLARGPEPPAAVPRRPQHEGARPLPTTGRVTEGPWFDNNLATLEVRGPGLVLRWDTGVVEGRASTSPSCMQVVARRPPVGASSSVRVGAGRTAQGCTQGALGVEPEVRGSLRRP